MDFATLNMKFGEGTVWTEKYLCQWCLKTPLTNQTFEKYKDRGNCCSECNTKYAKIAMEENKESEISHRDRLIRQTRMEMDVLALKLDEEISEKERLEIVGEMERKHIKIKMLKESL